MAKKLRILFIAIVALVGAGFYAYRNYYPAIRPVINPPPEDIVKLIEEGNKFPAEVPKEGEIPPKLQIPANTTGMSLKLPQGFSISIFAKDLPGARVMAFDSFGNMWVSQTSRGIISLLEVKDGKTIVQNDIFTGLRKPHGLAFDPQSPTMLYYAEEDKISRVVVYSDGEPEKIADLPSGDGHFTRTLGFGPDGRLYVSIGSSCNICNESDSRRAKIFSMNKDGSDFKEFARGLRNAVFFAWNLVDGRMWATEMGRDWLGDNIPPDEINIIGGPSTSSGQNSVPNFGWPICYGKNIHDTDFDKNIYIRNPCEDMAGSHIDIPAHSAPLGLGFIPKEGWPEEYWYDLLVAYHGSWNRSAPTGYQVVRLKLDAQGNFSGFEDFITGWLTPKGEALGRPVDILIQPGGKMYISDDKAGVIYKIIYRIQTVRKL
ncbi:MAG: L-sorbosone dehydrogenase [Parcubacteria group bacterium GW2011_GWA2_45_30]|nr:MAG: L-sorbosone dehydrogenase [Parcubacteria group bacterium GW2011_GWA2_45_30]